MADNFRESSRKEWAPPLGEKPSREQIAVGCLQRIADACEKMVVTQEAIMKEASEAQRLRRQVRALRGVVTRLKMERAQP